MKEIELKITQSGLTITQEKDLAGNGKQLVLSNGAKVNFYKCGDLLPEPHFICWNKVETTDPDFHQPDFFAPVVFDEVKATASFKETVHG